jgi:hypothetical protein
MELVVGLIGLAGVVLGGAISHWSGAAQQRRERNERRAAVATALLTELPRIERGLRRLATHTSAALTTVRIAPEAYNLFAADVVSFSPETVSTLLRLHAFISDIAYSRENVSKPVPEEAHEYFRVKSALAAQLVPRVRALLEGEGGVSPTDPPTETIPPGVTPQLPPPAFPGASSDLPATPLSHVAAAEGDGE